jgi:hypothetical protein
MGRGWRPQVKGGTPKEAIPFMGSATAKYLGSIASGADTGRLAQTRRQRRSHDAMPCRVPIARSAGAGQANRSRDHLHLVTGFGKSVLN